MGQAEAIIGMRAAEGNSGYELVETSKLLPKLDVTMLATYVRPEAQFDAVLDFRDVIRQ